jgi:hypothetical protein
MLFVGVARSRRRRAAKAQPWTEESLQRKETNDQCEGEPEGSGEEVAHTLTSFDTKALLLRTATERTVKVHQSRTSK